MVLGSRLFRLQSLIPVEKGEDFMAKSKGVSSKTHTLNQLNDYANQHNPNNAAYKARVANEKCMGKKSVHKYFDNVADLDWMCYSNGPYEFD